MCATEEGPSCFCLSPPSPSELWDVQKAWTGAGDKTRVPKARNGLSRGGGETQIKRHDRFAALGGGTPGASSHPSKQNGQWWLLLALGGSDPPGGGPTAGLSPWPPEMLQGTWAGDRPGGRETARPGHSTKLGSLLWGDGGGGKLCPLANTNAFFFCSPPHSQLWALLPACLDPAWWGGGAQ